MSKQTDQIDSRMASVADDAIKLFRLNVFVIGVYLTVLAFAVERANFIAVVRSPYTAVGILLWFGVAAGSIITYRGSRLRSATDYNPSRHGAVPNEETLVRNVVGVSVGTLVMIVGLGIGVVDGASDFSIPIYTPVALLLFGIGFVGASQIFLTSILIALYQMERLNTVIGERIRGYTPSIDWFDVVNNRFDSSRNEDTEE